MKRYLPQLLRVLVGLLSVSTLASCSIWDAGQGDFIPESVFGRRPVYFPIDSAGLIFSDAPRPLRNSTGVVKFENFLYTIDQGSGVHVVDNTDPRRSIAIAFIHVPGIRTLTAGKGRLYANNFGDLITIDIDDPRKARVIDRDAGLFQETLDFPENYIGYFECYDPARGPLLRWEEANISKPECRINFF